MTQYGKNTVRIDFWDNPAGKKITLSVKMNIVSNIKRFLELLDGDFKII